MGHLPPAGGKDYAARIIIVIILYYSKCGGKGKEQNARPAQLAGGGKQVAFVERMGYNGSYNPDRIEDMPMRPDGTRVKNLPPIVAAIPYIMPKRYDAQNSITENIDEEVLKAYIREKRRSGIRINHMAVIIAAYYKAVQTNPKLNYFVMNSRIYKRNHFCVSFVILKKLADGSPDETTLKIFLEPQDTVFTIQQKIADAVDANSRTEQKNSTDKFARFMFSVPGLPKFVVWLAYHLDKHGLLPRKIIDLSPFHTSMFITNLASIKTSYIHHHCYEFGTTSVFVCMGRPVPNYMSGDLHKKMMPLGIVMDERICTGYEYASFCSDFRKYIRQPELLETPFDGSAVPETAAGETTETPVSV